MHMKIFFILLAASLLVACESNKTVSDFYTIKRPSYKIDTEKYAGLINREASGPGYIIRKRAADVYELQYFRATEHMAFAQSDSGAWGWSENRASPESAMDRALEKCERTNGRWQQEQPCQVINIDGFWITDFFRKRKIDLSN